MLLLDELKRCIRFLEINGWVVGEADGDEDEYFHFNKEGCVGIDVSVGEMVFIGEFGDFLHLPTSYYALIGALLELRQISVSYVGIHKEK
jgi:hypothetical protein